METNRIAKPPAGTQNIALAAEFFGGVKLRRGRRALSGFATQKVVGLFCYLLDAGAETISRDKLIVMFWGESPEDQARYNLRYALWNIRKVFKETEDDPDPLLSSRSVCQLNPDIALHIDCHSFERLLETRAPTDRPANLMQALELYKGPFLDGFALRNLPEWEEWLYHRREALHQAFLSASGEVGDYCLRTGQAALAADVYLRSLALAPDLERAHEGLIRAYADQGRVSAAVRQFNLFRELMKREFSAPPTPQILRLIEALRSGTYEPTPRCPPLQAGEATFPPSIEGGNRREVGSESSALAETTPPTPPSVEGGDTNFPQVGEKLIDPAGRPESPPLARIPEELLPSPSGKPDVPFIGRREELRDLKNLVMEVQSGQGLVVIISGEMGIGKTRLFSEFVRLLPDDFILGIGESREIESTRPLEDLMQVLESIGRDPRLTHEAKEELKALFVLQEKVIGAVEGTSEPHLLEGVRRWIVSLAKQQPILIALDDMHWAGEALQKVFSALAQEVKRLPLLLIGIFRTFEENSEDTIASALISIARTGRLRRIELGSLSFEDIAEILRKKAPELALKLTPAEAERLFRYSAGIPLYAIELANTLLEGQTDFIRSPALIDQPDFTPTGERNLVPPLLQKISRFRLSQFAPDYVRLLRAGSLILGDFSLDLAGQIVPVDRDALEDIMVELEHRNIMHNLERGGRLSFGFNHQMLKLAIAETIPVLERQRLFREILKAVEVSGEPISNDARAYYLYNSGNRADAIPALLTSARFWFGGGDRNTGLRYSKVACETALERIADDPDKMLEVVLEHSDLLIQLGSVKSAIDVLTNALEKISGQLASSTNLQSRRAELTKMLASGPGHPIAGRTPLAVINAKRAIADVKLLQGDAEGAGSLIAEVEGALERLPGSDETLRATGLLFLVKAKLLLKTNEASRAIPLLESAAELLRSHGTEPEIAEVNRLTARAHLSGGGFLQSGERSGEPLSDVPGGGSVRRTGQLSSRDGAADV